MPNHVAARHGARHLSYAQLEARANRLAHTLRKRGIRQGSFVGIALARSIDMLAALLAVLKTGATYVPLDPQFPAERLAFMAEDARAGDTDRRRRHTVGLRISIITRAVIEARRRCH